MIPVKLGGDIVRREVISKAVCDRYNDDRQVPASDYVVANFIHRPETQPP